MTIPSSTYRLQITRDFTLTDAAELTGYLRDLGVGAVYLSPVLQSTIGSDHGYDTTDPTQIDRDRGGQAGLQQLLTAARGAGLGTVIDIVPNHLGISVPAENPAWWDVLRFGRDSAYAGWFDIDWSRDRIIVPVLGDDQTLKVVGDELHYFDHRFPLAPGSSGDGDDPSEVHARQHYELVHWTRGNEELSYRRFFAVTTLAGIRVEDPDVLEATHAVVARWAGAGVTGLRIDHPDGLVDPGEYLRRLRAMAPEQWITVEKILEPGERLPADWPVEGTTGYDAMREVGGLFIDRAHESDFTDLYQRMTGDQRSIAEHIEVGKQLVVRELLPAELHRMARLVPDVVGAEAALAEVAVAFEVYRSYLPEGADDLDRALALAAERRPEVAATLDQLSPRLHDHHDELARRLQQLSGATMAKGVEDTAYYRYSRFIALNEVGGNPDEFGVTPEEFHQLQVERQSRQPQSMTALSTHDTKRGEDIRARLAVLSEIPDRWGAFAEHFLSTTSVPNLAFGYLLAQTVVGAGPIERERMHAYAEKAMREASDGTTWTVPDEPFERAVHAAVDLAYDDPRLRAAWDELDAAITAPGWSNSVGQKLVQLTMPGVPDVYQGTELWEDSLVDPDNRRPVDFGHRSALLAGLAGLTRLAGLAGSRPALDASGVAKLWVTRQALWARREHPDFFSGYAALTATGPAAAHLVAFDRGGALTLATRLPVGLQNSGGWGTTTLRLPGRVRNVLTDQQLAGDVALAEVLADQPVALLLAD